MYAAGPASSTELISEDQEAYLLGRRSVNKLLDSRGENEVMVCVFLRITETYIISTKDFR